MKVKLSTEKTYSFEIGGKRFSDYREASSWEGLTKYEKGTSWLILLTEGAPFAYLEGIFGAAEYHVVMGSPDIVEAVMRVESQPPAEAETIQ